MAKPLPTGAISELRKTMMTHDIVAVVAAYVNEDWCVTCKDINSAYGGVQWDKAQHPLR
jgi:hypothetical protein